MHCINNQYFKPNSMSFGLTYFCHISDSVGIVHQFSLVHFNFSESETKEFNLVLCRTLSIQNSGFNGGNLRICEGYCFTFKTSSWKPSLLLKRLYNRIKFHRKQILNYSLMVKLTHIWWGGTFVGEFWLWSVWFSCTAWCACRWARSPGEH